jgi:hypothetical protein
VQRLDRLEPERVDSVKQPLTGSEQDRDHVERQLVDHPGGERLTNGRGAARDVDVTLAGRLERLRVGALKAIGDAISTGSRAWWVSTKTGAW